MSINLEPESGWQPLPRAGVRTFLSGGPDDDRVRVRYFRDASGAVAGKAWFGSGAQGPPGHVHGGAMASVLDEAMGAAAWLAGHVVLAARLTTGFHRMLPLDSVVRIETRIAAVNGRKVTVQSALRDGAGELICDAEGLYLEIELERMDESGQRAIRKAMTLLGRGRDED
jgi:acyl-coenzyme A thioesterase PaaI-like protein